MTKLAPTSREVSCGSLPATGEPSGRTPLPASGWHQEAPPVAVHSVACCAPYLATEKPQRRLRSIGVQPIVGTVISASPPAARVSAMKRSAAEPYGRAPGLALVSSTFWKNQSKPRLEMSSSQE